VSQRFFFAVPIFFWKCKQGIQQWSGVN
jgi:hypothetical protein